MEYDPRDKRRSSRSRIRPEDVPLIWRRLRRGDLQHEIAAAFGVNQGRISEINTGKRFAEITRRLRESGGA